MLINLFCITEISHNYLLDFYYTRYIVHETFDLNDVFYTQIL